MAASRPLSLLDLPAEIRVMIYENLPTRTAHRYQADHPSQAAGIGDVFVVWRSFPGVTILATCRLVEREARPIIEARLRAIRNEPCRVIVTPEGLASTRLSSILKSLLRSNVDNTKPVDPRDIINVALYQPMTHHTARVRVDKSQGSYHLFWFESRDEAPDGYQEGLHVHVRPALLTDEEEWLFDAERPLTQVMPIGLATPAKTVTDGTTIEDEEWDEDWAGGLRYF
ncbi:hypothetical protein HBI56_158160 [Parastagonospora nodorum]|nr:hypothetical protein HBI09_173460 [Parastagonospora nodorum]KAH4045337.1 hypothetical protein HBH49_202720 [Parastagonospora nodorum]KAH4117820.1 hypothetical protein HBH47_148640 [Parastagonospora nodorum]KAH4178950.1 hypothetical protein HBH43_030840 [Parastagonospora nodorum]KAH4207265.1 hypothetical protein HBI95_114510 [Parastagonospora nodorum]